MDSAKILLEALHGPSETLVTRTAALIEREAPGRSFLSTQDWYFRLQKYAAAGQCEIRPVEGAALVLAAEYKHDGKNTAGKLKSGCLRVVWNSKEITLFLLLEPHHDHWMAVSLIVGENQQDAYQFHNAVCKWWDDQQETGIMVFDGSCFDNDLELRDSIKASTLDDVVLAGDLKRRIADDVCGFFQSEQTYAQYKIPWKRGVIFTGPPGNGKTQMVKALINQAEVPSLYIRSFQSRYSSELGSIQEVFSHARRIAPCVMVLEDLDSLVTASSRSPFLNELDGFYENNGILILATCNYPEKLDPAILDRPSRFDRKYAFNMPGVEERVKYMDLLSLRLDESVRPSDELIYQIAVETDGFSFAYLKELFLSSLIHWVNAEPKPTIQQSMLRMIPVLREQIRLAHEAMTQSEDSLKEEGPDD